MSIQNQDKEEKDNKAYSSDFARIPNMVFVSYKYLTKEEKHLYCTLKAIYWDAKPRFVSLRELAVIVDFSVGALSKMLPRLHTCGLIHAEIRRERVILKPGSKQQKEKGNAKYNITILDIWELNRKFFTCSPNEQVLLDPSLKLVHEKEQACSPNDTSLFTKRDKPVTFREQVPARVERAKDSKDILKDISKERESCAKPVTSSQPKDVSLSPDIFLNLLEAYNAERIACLQSIGTPVGKIKAPAPGTAEHTKLTEWATAGMTEQDIRDRFHRFWDLKDRKGRPDTFWQTNGVSIKVFCEHDEIGNAPVQPTSLNSHNSRHDGQESGLTVQGIHSPIQELEDGYSDEQMKEIKVKMQADWKRSDGSIEAMRQIKAKYKGDCRNEVQGAQIAGMMHGIKRASDELVATR